MKPDSIRMMPIGDIQPYSNNPRRHDNISEVKESIRRVGFRGSIWIDANNVIIAGHGRYMAAKELGMKEVPVTVMDDLTEAEVKYLRIKDNRASEQSTWDDDAYLKELDELREMDFDVGDIEMDVGAVDIEGFGEDFTLPDGEKADGGIRSFTLTGQQMEIVDQALEVATGGGTRWATVTRTEIS